MIFIIGDIHATFDNLCLLTQKIYELCETDNIDLNSVKLVFLGDYIDRGPCAKQVVDHIRNLPFEKILLCGNHEAMLMDFLSNNHVFKKWPGMWFKNGAFEAIKSFSEKYEPDFLRNLKRLTNPNIKPAKGMFEKIRETFQPYSDFFRKLKIFHTEKVTLENGTENQLVFSHSSPGEIPARMEEANIPDYDGLLSFCRKNGLDVLNSPLYYRRPKKTKEKDRIYIHGHTPVHALDEIKAPAKQLALYRELHKNEPLLLPFFNFGKTPDRIKKYEDGAETIIEIHGVDIDDLISINIDTGAVYGKRLTAMMVDEKNAFAENSFSFLQTDPQSGFNNPLTSTVHLKFILDNKK